MTNEDFFNHVIKRVAHDGWKLEWYKQDSSEGWCSRATCTIKIGPKNENIKRLILHEIAHIYTCLNKRNQHELEFWKVYEELLSEYLPGTLLSSFDKTIKKVYNIKL